MISSFDIFIIIYFLNLNWNDDDDSLLKVSMNLSLKICTSRY